MSLSVPILTNRVPGIYHIGEAAEKAYREFSLMRTASQRVVSRFLSQPLSREAIQWLKAWSFSHNPPRLTTELIREFTRFRPSHPVKLYRFEKAPEDAHKKQLRSFTYERGMVEFMAETDAQEGGHGEILEEIVTPSRILVDLTRLPSPWTGGSGANALLNEVVVTQKPI